MKKKVEELERLSLTEFKKSPKTPIVLILDNIRSRNNVGAIFRTADCFRIQKICLCGITPVPPHRDINKTAIGSTSSVDWKYYKNTNEALKDYALEGYILCVVEQVHHSINLDNFVVEPNKKYALILGNELNGVHHDVISKSDVSVEIPQIGTKHSFNVASSSAIAMWHFFLSIESKQRLILLISLVKSSSFKTKSKS